MDQNPLIGSYFSQGVVLMGVGSRAMMFKDNGSIQVDILLPLQPDDFSIEDNLSFNMGWQQCCNTHRIYGTGI